VGTTDKLLLLLRGICRCEINTQLQGKHRQWLLFSCNDHSVLHVSADVWSHLQAKVAKENFVFVTVHHNIDLFQITNLMHNSFIL